MAEIPGLPAELRTVPPGPASPDDPDRHKKREAWRDWRDAVIRYRVQRSQECADNSDHQQIENRKCAQSPAYWLTVWGVLYEPRRRKRIKGTDTPFIPFPKQVDLLQFFQDCLAEDDGPLVDGVVSKCRDVGASWVMCAFALWGWLYETPWQVRLISRKKDLVESRSADSLFWKIDYLFHRLPTWMVPDKTDYNDVDLHFTNLLNGNEISGESTTKKAVRGGRATWVGYDEAAFIEDFLHTWSAAQAVADSRFAISTESLDAGMDFWNLSQNDKVPEKPRRFAIDYWDNPTLDDEWLEKTRSRYLSSHDEKGFYREVLRNPIYGGDTWVYPEARSIVLSSEWTYNPSLPQFTSIDPGFRDDCAIVFAQEDTYSGLIHILDSYSNNGKPADFYGSVISGKIEVDRWANDYDVEAHRIMAWTKDRPAATVFGDMYGFNNFGATHDSFYSRLVPYGIYVVRDRLKDGRIAQSTREAKTPRGLREAMHELFPRLRFANTPGAARVAEALENHRFKETGSATMAEDKMALHDWTSHLCAAIGYLAVNKVLGRRIVEMTLAQPERLPHINHRRRPDSLARWEERKVRNAAW